MEQEKLEQIKKTIITDIENWLNLGFNISWISNNLSQNIFGLWMFNFITESEWEKIESIKNDCILRCYH